MKTTKEKFIWDIVTEILENHGDFVDDISIHEHEDIDEHRKVYCSQGYCFELSKKEIDLAEDESNDEAFEEDGILYEYFFTEPWDEFKEAGIRKAIEILNTYAGLSLCESYSNEKYNGVCRECSVRMIVLDKYPLPECYKGELRSNNLRIRTKSTKN